MNDPVFEVRRTFILMRNDIVTNARTLLVTAALIGGVVFLYGLFAAVFDPAASGGQTLFGVIVPIGGLILSSIAFSETHDRTKGLSYFMLPASLLEKYVSRLVLTSLGWVLGVLILFVVGGSLGSGIGYLLFGNEFSLFWIGGIPLWDTVSAYLVAQAVFAFGSLYFKNFAFLKVTASLILYGTLYLLFTLLAGRLVFLDQFAHFMPTTMELEALFSHERPEIQLFSSVLEVTGRIFAWAILPLFFWILGYRRLRETEV